VRRDAPTRCSQMPRTPPLFAEESGDPSELGAQRESGLLTRAQVSKPGPRSNNGVRRRTFPHHCLLRENGIHQIANPGPIESHIAHVAIAANKSLAGSTARTKVRSTTSTERRCLRAWWPIRADGQYGCGVPLDDGESRSKQLSQTISSRRSRSQGIDEVDELIMSSIAAEEEANLGQHAFCCKCSRQVWHRAPLGRMAPTIVVPWASIASALSVQSFEPNARRLRIRPEAARWALVVRSLVELSELGLGYIAQQLAILGN